MADQQNLDAVLNALRQAGTTSRSVQQNKRYTPGTSQAAAARRTTNDMRLDALRRAPELADKINAIASGKSEPPGALGTLGKVLVDNPISKVVLNGLQTIDMPRRAVISAVRELTDLVDSDPATQASFGDFFKQAKDVNYGFGTAFPMEGWGGRIVGFIGDVALDPLTYATIGAAVPAKATVKAGLYAGKSLRAALGVKTLAGAEGRFALARLAKQMGATDDIVRNIAARGRTAVPADIASNMGLGRSGIYYFGSRVRVPFTGPIGDAIGKGLATTRLGFFDTAVGQKLGRQFALRGANAATDTSAQRFALATGKATPEQASAFVGEFAAQDTLRAQKSFAVDRAVKYIRPVFEDPEIDLAQGTVFRLLDTPQAKWAEQGITPTAPELRAYEKIRPILEQMHRDVEAAHRALDPEFEGFGFIEDYLPHVASREGLDMMNDLSSPYAKQVRQYLEVNMTDNAASFRSRNLRKGSEWFGQPLTQKDIDGGIQQLNKLFRERTGLNFDFFETDIKKILERYSGYYGQQIGIAKYMEELKSQGLLQVGRMGIEFNDEMYQATRKAVKTAANNVSMSMNDAYNKGRQLSTLLSQAFDYTTRAKATTSRPVGPLAQTVKDAKSTLKSIPTADVAEARLTSARALLEETITDLQESWRQFANQFEEQSEILEMLQLQHQNMVKAHQNVLDQIDYIVVNYQDEISPTGLTTIKGDVLKANIAGDSAKPRTLEEEVMNLMNQIANLDDEISTMGAKWENILIDQDRFLNDFDGLMLDPHGAKSGGSGDLILGILKPYEEGKEFIGVRRTREARGFAPWAGQNVDPAVAALRNEIDPKGKFKAAALEKMTMQEVREIIGSGFSSTSDLNGLHKAATFLVARDTVLNGGVLATDPQYMARLDKLKKLVKKAEIIDDEIKGAKTTSTKIERIAKTGRGEADETVAKLQQQNDELLRELNEIDNQIETVGFLGGEADDLRAQAANLEKEFASVNKRLNDAIRNRDTSLAKLTDVEREAVETVIGGSYREFAEEFAEAVSEYYLHSQVNMQFRRQVAAAADYGLVPTEEMYNRLVATTAKYDLEIADGVVQDVAAAETTLVGIRDRVMAYKGRDKNAFLLNELMTVFNDPARVAEAQSLRATFPEIEAVVMKTRDSMRSGRAFFSVEGGYEVAFNSAKMMEEFGLIADFGAETGRRITRGARAVSMEGRFTADEVQNLSIRQIGSRESQAARMDSIASQVNANIKKLRNFAESGKATPEQIERINFLDRQYNAVKSTVKERSDEAKRAIARISDSKNTRTNETVLKNIVRMGDAYGIAGSLQSALRGGPTSVDAFFADLLGGVKFDVRQGYTTVKRQGNKLRQVDPKIARFANYTEDALGRRVDMNGRLVNRAHELVDENGNLVNEAGELLAEGATPVKGSRSTRPTVTIDKDRSMLGKIKQTAKSRLMCLQSISDDVEFIPADQVMRGTITDSGNTTFSFADNIYGPRAYANQLELAIDVLDDKIKEADRLAKQVGKKEKELAAVAAKKSGPTPLQAKAVQAARREARAAVKRLDDLTGGEVHLRAVERQRFHDFLVQLASFDANTIGDINWRLTNLDAGIPVTRGEILNVNSFHIKRIEQNIRSLRDQAASIQRKLNPPRQYRPETLDRGFRQRNAMLQKQLSQINQQIAEHDADLLKLRTQLAAAEGRIKAPNDFRFTKDEFNSLWSKRLSNTELSAKYSEYNELQRQLNARVGQKSSATYANWAPERVAENNAKIAEISSKMQEIESIINEERLRDSALKKAKFLFDNFESQEYQVSNTLAKTQTRAVPGTARVFPVESAGILDTTAKRSVREVTGREYRTADDALRVFAQGKKKDVSFKISSRRKLLSSEFESSPEGLHLREVAEAQAKVQSDINSRPNWAEKAARLRAQKNQILREIADKRGEIKELEIGRTVSDIQDIISKASGVTGKRLPKVKGADVAGARAAKAALEGQITETRGSRKYFKISEELFGTAEAFNLNGLTEKQLRMRDLVQQLNKLEFDILAEKQAQRDAIEAIQALSKISDRQAEILNLPKLKRMEESVNLAALLRDQMVVVNKIRKPMEATEKKIADKWATLNEAVKKAKNMFDLSTTVRVDAEKNLEDALKQIETVRELAKKNTQIRNGIKKKDLAWTEEMDEFLNETAFLMPLIEKTDLEKPVKDMLTAYVKARGAALEAKAALDVAEQEKLMLKGIKEMVGKDPKAAMQAMEAAPVASWAGAVNVVTNFDEGFVQLSRFYPNIGVRKELAEIVQNVHRAQDPLIVRELSKFLSGYTKFFKGYATLSPGFHIRNAMSNGFMLFAAGGNPKYLGEAMQYSKGWTAASRAGRQFDDWIKTVPEAKRQMVQDAMLAAAASGGGMTDEALKDGALWGTKTSKKVGQWLEQHSRFMLAYDGIRSGMDMSAASARVRRFLIDYENVSNADLLMRQIMPFWMWTSRNLPLQIQNIWLNPRPYQIYGSIKRNLRDEENEVDVPEWMREMGAFKLPFGQNLYATPDFGFNRIGQQVNELRDPARFASNFNPLIRLPIELAGDRQLYSNRPFSDEPVEINGGVASVLQPFLQLLGYGETGPTGKKFVDDRAYYLIRSLVPTLSQAERLIPSTPAYQERGILNPLLGYTGAPVRQVTPQMQQSENIRMQVAMRELLRNQKVLEEGN